MTSDLCPTKALRPDDPCEFRFPARDEWRPGRVVRNGSGWVWEVRDDETGMVVQGLYIEYVRAPGTDPWGGGS